MKLCRLKCASKPVISCSYPVLTSINHAGQYSPQITFAPKNQFHQYLKALAHLGYNVISTFSTSRPSSSTKARQRATSSTAIFHVFRCYKGRVCRSDWPRSGMPHRTSMDLCTFQISHPGGLHYPAASLWYSGPRYRGAPHYRRG